MKPANENMQLNAGTAARGYFCPACGGASVSASQLSGGLASCGICAWTGKTEDLAVVPFTHDFSSDEEMLHALLLDMRKIFTTEVVMGLGRLLLKWGFLTGIEVGKDQVRVDPKALARYVGVCAGAFATAILREREKIERERVGLVPPPPVSGPSL